MAVHYYVSIFPTEALIASELDPEAFGSYMATGAKKGAFEKIIFMEVNGEFGDNFDWGYAKDRCVSHPNGDPKHSVYLSVYRVLENIPLNECKNLFLTTRDGRTLELQKQEIPKLESKSYYVYQELCPITPLVVSALPPAEFASTISKKTSKVYVPTIAFADLKVIDFDNSEQTGNIGAIYDRNIGHLKECINSVVNVKEKPSKTVERAPLGSFGYQIINGGIYVGNEEKLIFYPMKSSEELRRNHYDWARSAQII